LLGDFSLRDTLRSEKKLWAAVSEGLGKAVKRVERAARRDGCEFAWVKGSSDETDI